MKRHKWAAAFTACLLAFTVYISMDTFVLSSAYQTDATEVDLSSIRSASEAEAEAKVETGVEDEEDYTEELTSEDEDTSEEDSGDDFTSEDEDTSEEDSESDGSGEEAESGDDDDDSSEDSESSHHRKKPDGSHGGPGSGSDGSGERGSKPGGSGSNSASGSGGSGKSRGGPGSGNSSSASTTSIKNFDEEEAAASVAEVTTDNADAGEVYKDENIKITYTQYTTNDTTIHVADVQLSSAEYLKTAFANDTYGKNVTQSTSDIAAANNAILAINGDYYGVQEKGYVIRNGVLYREEAGTNDVLCIFGDGSMKVIDPSTITAQQLIEEGAWQAFSFGPGLLEDGEIPISLDTEVGRARASNPRTAIGIIDNLHYVFVVSDGRSDESEGLSLYELATFMQQLGVKTAYNLDGGGSSTMVFQGEVINNPTSGFKDDERKVSDIVYIG